MSTVNVTDSTLSLPTGTTRVTDNVGNVNVTSEQPISVTDTTTPKLVTEETMNQTESIIGTNMTLARTTTSNHTSSNISNVTVTGETFYNTSASTPFSERMSTSVRSSTLKSETSSVSSKSSKVLSASTTSASPVTSSETSNRVNSGAEVCDDNTTTVAIVSGVSVGVVVLVLLMSALCFFRLRHKWRSKIQLERKKTDIWSMATFNNTIINENFNDYQLASPTRKDIRKSSGISENSVQFYDPFTGATPQAQLQPNHDIFALRSDTISSEQRSSNSTLRRNTVSAPDELDLSPKALKVEQDSLGFYDHRYTLRGRSSTFNLGKKQNVDRHVLLSHEELVEDNADGHQGDTVYRAPASSYFVTEL